MRFIDPSLILEMIGNLAYRVNLPQKIICMHNVFRVFHLWMFVHGSNMKVESNQLSDIEVALEALRPYSPIPIVAHDIKHLRWKMVELVKVQWSEREGY